jgi:hypothetical protein
MKLHIVVSALGVALLTGCASTGPSGEERWVEVLPSAGTGAGVSNLARPEDGLRSIAASGASITRPSEEHEQVASEPSDSCSGSRRMARIRCHW